MKDTVSAKSNTESQATGLSVKFWQLADALIEGWDLMNRLLHKEWQVLKGREIKLIWKIGRQKEKLASQLEAIERRIDDEIQKILPTNTDPKNRWHILLKTALPSEKERLITWKSRLNNEKNRAFVINRRLWVWISEQQQLTRELTEILAGRRKNHGATYSFNGNSTSRRGFGPSTEYPDNDSPGDADHDTSSKEFFSGFSQDRVKQAIKAYGRTECGK